LNALPDFMVWRRHWQPTTAFTVESINIHSSPVIVSGTAPPPVNERNDRLTNSLSLVTATFIAAASCLLHVVSNLQLQKF